MSTDKLNIKEDMQRILNDFTFTFFLSLLPDLFLKAPVAHSKVFQHHKSEPAHLLPAVSTGGQNPQDNVNNMYSLTLNKNGFSNSLLSPTPKNIKV